jgi:folate-dependent tRNA-U54 methylase TrmFO/GidA
VRAQSILRATIGRSTLGKGLASTAAWWNALPDGHKVTLFNVRAGRRRIDAFRARLRADLSGVLDLLAQGASLRR